MFGSGDPDNPMGGLLGDLLEGDRLGARCRRTAGSRRPAPWPSAWPPTTARTRTPTRSFASPSRSWPGWPSSTWPTRRGSRSEHRRRLLRGGRARDSGASACSRPTGPCSRRWWRRSSRGPRRCRASMDLSELDPDASAGLGGLLGQFALTLGPVFLGMQFGSAAGPPGPPRLRAVRPPAALARVVDPAARAGQRGALRRGLEPPAPGGAALGLPARAHHARRADPARRPVLARRPCSATRRRTPPRHSGPSSSAWARAWATRRRSRSALGDPEALLSDLISPEQRNISSALTAQTTAHRRLRRPRHGRHRRDADLVTRRAARGLVPLPDRGGQGRAGLRRPVRAQRRPGRGGPGRAFVTGVVERAGEDALARLWADELDLPTPAEVDAPGLWLARIGLLD